MLPRFLKRFAAALLAAVLLLTGLPFAARAQTAGKTVRVGWFESPFNQIDRYGRRTGYAYEYQLKIAAYTGWEYENVEGTWPELMQMLKDGKIDLLSDVSYTEERTEFLLFPSIPMGAEEYYLFVEPERTGYSSGDYAWIGSPSCSAT